MNNVVMNMIIIYLNIVCFIWKKNIDGVFFFVEIFKIYIWIYDCNLWFFVIYESKLINVYL